MSYIINNPTIGILENTRVAPHVDRVGIFHQSLFEPEPSGKTVVDEDVFWRVRLQPYVIDAFALKSRFHDKIPEWFLVGFAKLIWNNAFRDNNALFDYAFNGPVDRDSKAHYYRQFHCVDLDFMDLEHLSI